MAKAKVKQRKDSKGRVLQKGESQRKLDGMYIYTYVNPYGKRCYVYSKDLFTLREKEQELIKAQMDGLDYYVGGHATINMTFDRYMSTKHNLRETTRSNYLYMFNRFIREDFGNKFLTEVKYTDVKLFYYHLLNEKDIAINTLDTIHTVLHPIFDMAVRDDIFDQNDYILENKFNEWVNKYNGNMKASDFVTLGFIESMCKLYTAQKKLGEKAESFNRDLKIIAMGTCIMIQMSSMILNQKGIIKKGKDKGKKAMVPGAKWNVILTGAMMKAMTQEMAEVTKVRKEVNKAYSQKIESS